MCFDWMCGGVGSGARHARDASSTAVSKSGRSPPGKGIVAERHGREGSSSFCSTRFTTRSAVARAVVYFAPTTLIRPSMRASL